MAIKKFNTRQEYNAASKSTTESTVSLIAQGNEVEFDGINVVTTEPACGDLVFKDDSGKRVYVKTSTLNKSRIPSNWTHIGYVVARFGNQKLIADKNESSAKYADVVQFELNAPTLDGESHTATIGVRVAGGTSAGYGSNTSISYTYASTSLSGVVTALNNAIEAAQQSLGFTNVLWAYLANDNNEKVESDADATKIMVQFDSWANYQQYICSGMTHVTWGDMPANSNAGFRGKNLASAVRVMNNARAAVYFGTNGVTPTSDVPLNAATNPVTSSAFVNSEYCALLRQTYGTYINYIKEEYHAVYPQNLGVFGLPSAKELTEKYGNKIAPTKTGGTKYMFPALHYGAAISYDIADMAAGKWFIPGAYEGCIFMDDDVLSTIAAAAQKMGAPVPNNSASRWLAQRSGVNVAWFFYGYYGRIDDGYVTVSYAVRGCTLLSD